MSAHEARVDFNPLILDELFSRQMPLLTNASVREKQIVRANLVLRLQYRGCFVAFRDRWNQDRLQRDILAVASTQHDLESVLADRLQDLSVKQRARVMTTLVTDTQE